MAPKGFRLGAFIVEPGTDRVLDPTAGGLRVELEPKTMAVLLALVERCGQVVSSEELIHCVWRDRPMGDNPVYKAVGKLRRALHDDAGEPRYIETIPRKGYRLLVAPEPFAPVPEPEVVADPRPDDASRAAKQVTPNVYRLSRFAMAGLALVVAGVGIASVNRAARPPPEPAKAAVATARSAGAPVADPSLAALPFEARQAYLLARSELQERRLGFARRMRKDAEDLIEAAPSFAPGHALRAIACTFRAAHSRDPAKAPHASPAIDGIDALQCARQSSRLAFQLAPGSAEALSAAGFLAWFDSQQCRAPCDRRRLQDSAQASLEEAVRRDPSLPEAHTWLGMVYQGRGDLVQAAGQAEAALAIDPLNPVATYNANVFLMARGEYAKVRERLVALTRRPDVPPFILGQLVENALAAGDRDDTLHWTRELSRMARGREVAEGTLASLDRVVIANAGLP
jgi:DNA-binding winged helix-turn-helix (wHTH) protein/tetratricopeptide (TPR) repeat protein